jgi:hypothetical protein
MRINPQLINNACKIRNLIHTWSKTWNDYKYRTCPTLAILWENIYSGLPEDTIARIQESIRCQKDEHIEKNAWNCLKKRLTEFDKRYRLQETRFYGVVLETSDTALHKTSSPNEGGETSGGA